MSELANLKLWVCMLARATFQGTNINHVTITKYTAMCCSDVCELGIGGYTKHGLSWRYKLPTDLIGVFSLNALQFIAAVITIWLHLIHEK